MYASVRDDLRATIDEIRDAGLYKPERVIGTPQSASVAVTAGGAPGDVLNFCANNYLGLADHPEVVAAAHEALD
ncbi:glycine C-acetyltransferase, partial [Streptomyces sp. NPDC054847]